MHFTGDNIHKTQQQKITLLMAFQQRCPQREQLAQHGETDAPKHDFYLQNSCDVDHLQGST